MAGFVAYYRLSKDGRGWGIQAQQDAISSYTAERGKMHAAFTEIESGRWHENRPELAAAMALAKKMKATLVIAKLDRLGRNVAFISALMESGVPFIACDQPQASKLTLHILAAMAEYERDIISARVKAGLAAAKARGVVLGNPRLAEAQQRGLAVIAANRRKAQIQGTA